MRPEYKLVLRHSDFKSLSKLTRAEEYESYINLSPPTPSLTSDPETEYVHKRRSDRFVEGAVVEHPKATNNSSTAKSNHVWVNSTLKEQPGLTIAPTSPRTANPAHRLPTPSVTVDAHATTGILCWNCDGQGHLFRDCPPTKI